MDKYIDKHMDNACNKLKGFMVRHLDNNCRSGMKTKVEVRVKVRLRSGSQLGLGLILRFGQVQSKV